MRGATRRVTNLVLVIIAISIPNILQAQTCDQVLLVREAIHDNCAYMPDPERKGYITCTAVGHLPTPEREEIVRLVKARQDFMHLRLVPRGAGTVAIQIQAGTALKTNYLTEVISEKLPTSGGDGCDAGGERKQTFFNVTAVTPPTYEFGYEASKRQCGDLGKFDIGTVRNQYRLVLSHPAQVPNGYAITPSLTLISSDFSGPVRNLLNVMGALVGQPKIFNGIVESLISYLSNVKVEPIVVKLNPTTPDDVDQVLDLRFDASPPSWVSPSEVVGCTPASLATLFGVENAISITMTTSQDQEPVLARVILENLRNEMLDSGWKVPIQ